MVLYIKPHACHGDLVQVQTWTFFMPDTDLMFCTCFLILYTRIQNFGAHNIRIDCMAVAQGPDETRRPDNGRTEE
jgi:hypothetical protein